MLGRGENGAGGTKANIYFICVTKAHGRSRLWHNNTALLLDATGAREIKRAYGETQGISWRPGWFREQNLTDTMAGPETDKGGIKFEQSKSQPQVPWGHGTEGGKARGCYQ